MVCDKQFVILTSGSYMCGNVDLLVLRSDEIDPFSTSFVKRNIFKNGFKAF